MINEWFPINNMVSRTAAAASRSPSGEEDARWVNLFGFAGVNRWDEIRRTDNKQDTKEDEKSFSMRFYAGESDVGKLLISVE